MALIWNDRVSGDPIHEALDAIFAEFGGAKRAALAAHENRADVPSFFGASLPHEFSWPHGHCLDENGLASLVFSRSYIPERNSPAGKEVSIRVRHAFDRFSSAGTVTVRYKTVAIIGRPA